jgi:hypothetical protein
MSVRGKLFKKPTKTDHFFNPETDTDPDRKPTFEHKTDPDPDRLPKVNPSGLFRGDKIWIQIDQNTCRGTKLRSIWTKNTKIGLRGRTKLGSNLTKFTKMGPRGTKLRSILTKLIKKGQGKQY